jgi:hypothetical protein
MPIKPNTAVNIINADLDAGMKNHAKINTVSIRTIDAVIRIIRMAL